MMTKKWTIAIVILILVIPGVTPIGYSQRTDTSAIISHIEGFVDVMKVGSGEWVPLVEGYKPKQGDEIKTGTEGWVEISLGDSSLMRVGPDSHVIIRELDYFEVTKTETSVMELVKGKVRAWVTPFRSKGAAFSIETANATIGVRGTDFGAIFDPDTLTTTILGIESCVTVEYSELPGAGADT
ncbi:MAG: FecR family protein, partial [Deltaproteobacteria bacterium]